MDPTNNTHDVVRRDLNDVTIQSMTVASFELWYERSDDVTMQSMTGASSEV